MDESAYFQEEVPCGMFFANDAMLVDELRDRVTAHLKTEYINCNFSTDVQRDVTLVSTEARKMQSSNSLVL